MKKLLALLLALCLLLPAGLAAAETVFPLSEEKITFRIATWQRSGQVDYNDMLMWQKYEEMTNVHIDWIHLPDSTFVERRNAMFTQDDLPDAIYRAKFSLSDVNKYAAEEMLLPLDDLVDNYAPNLQKFFAEYPQVRKALTMEDGHLYSLGYFNICDGAKNTETLIKWVDYFYSQEGAELLFLVDEKLYNTDENGVRSYNDYVTKNPDGLTLTQVISQNTCWSGGNCPAILLNNVFIGGETMPIPMAAAKAMLPYLPKEIWEPLFFTVDQNDEMTPILTDLSACVKEYRAAFIGGTKDIDAEWDNYVNEINKMRVDRYLEIVQESLDSHDADK